MLPFLITAWLLVSILMNAYSARVPHSSPKNYEILADSSNSRNPIIGSKSGINTDSTLLNDSSSVFVTDTINLNDTIDIAEQIEIKDKITYKAEDSIVYDMNTRKMYLYNGADLSYEKIKLQSKQVVFDWNTYTLSAEGGMDSLYEDGGKAVFSDGGQEYRAKRMDYNFKTKKGIVYEVTMKEGESFIHSKQVKKNEYGEWYGLASQYTTCDLDHPHFYFKAKKIKMVPNKVMVTGPVNLWVGDVPTPLVLPFALFPVKQGRKSGLILPEYGQDAVMGFFLRNGGYYWAMNDYVGLRFTTMISTNGTLGAGVGAAYALRYKFNGNISFNYLRTNAFDPDLPGAKPTNAYSFAWTHTQDPRSIPNSQFGASVQVQTADFFQASRVTDQRLLNTSFNSTINYAYQIPRTPLNLSVNFRHSQNLLDRSISFTLPTFRLSMSRVSPFKSKVQTGKPKWYENIGITYSFEFQNQIRTVDSTLFQRQTLDKFRMGINQVASIDAPITLFKYLNINPQFTYQERTYFKGIDKYWNPDTVYFVQNGDIDTLNGRVITDTVWRFNSSRNFNVSINMNTKLTGIFRFKNSKLKAIKHVFTPTVSFTYQPDFSQQIWGFYRTVQGDVTGNPLRYSVFEPDAIFGVPTQGKVGVLGFNLLNNFEAKVFSKKDTVSNEKKLGLIDQLSFSGSYNFLADSFQLSPFSLGIVSSRILNLINLNFNATFDPYAVDTFNRRIKTFEWQANRNLLRFATATIGASTTISSKPRTQAASQEAPKYMADYVSYNPNQFYDFDIPWTIGLNYRFNLSKGIPTNPDTLLIVQTLGANIDFNLTPHWKFAVSTGFDISRRQITLTNISVIRDLHCWELTFAWTPPLPTYRFQQFTILLHPKSNTLKDLKIQRRNNQLQDL